MNALLAFIFRMLFREGIRRAREKPKPIGILTYPNEVLIHWPGGRMESLSAAEARERGFEREAEKAEWKQLEKEEGEWEEMAPAEVERLEAMTQAAIQELEEKWSPVIGDYTVRTAVQEGVWGTSRFLQLWDARWGPPPEIRMDLRLWATENPKEAMVLNRLMRQHAELSAEVADELNRLGLPNPPTRDGRDDDTTPAAGSEGRPPPPPS